MTSLPRQISILQKRIPASPPSRRPVDLGRLSASERAELALIERAGGETGTIRERLARLSTPQLERLEELAWKVTT